MSEVVTASMLGELDSLLEQAKVERADIPNAQKVQALVQVVADYQGLARQAARDMLRMLIGYLPAEERKKLNLFPLFDPPKQPEQIEKYLSICPDPPGTPTFTPMSFAELLALPPKVYLVDQIIGVRDIGAIYGPPGSGKTFVIIDLILSASIGRPFALRFAVPKRLAIAYCAGEGASGLPARFAAATEYYGVNKLPGFTFFATTPQLFDTGSFESVECFIKEWKERHAAGAAQPLDLLIIDTLHSATVGADENSAQDMGKVLSLAKLATKELGCAVLLVHHSNKAGTGERGSSALRGAMDVMIEIKKVAGRYMMSCEKLKEGEEWKAQTFRLVAAQKVKSVRVQWDDANIKGDDGSGKQQQAVDALIAVFRAAPGRKFTATALAEMIGLGGSKQIYKLLPIAKKKEEAIYQGLKEPDKDGGPKNPVMYWFEPQPPEQC